MGDGDAAPVGILLEFTDIEGILLLVGDSFGGLTK